MEANTGFQLQNGSGKMGRHCSRIATSVPAKDWVRLNIFATGIYEVANRKMIQVFDGSGTFVLTQGKLVSQSQTGNIVLWLLSDEKSGECIINVDAVGNAGDEFSARLKRTSEFPLPLQRRSSDK
jgi:hypothetical protein